MSAVKPRAEPQTPGEQAIALLLTLVEHGTWWPSAIEFSAFDRSIDGTKLHVTALRILENAKS